MLSKTQTHLSTKELRSAHINQQTLILKGSATKKMGLSKNKSNSAESQVNDYDLILIYANIYHNDMLRRQGEKYQGSKF